MSYKALIIEDEKGNRELLSDLLKKNCPQIVEINEVSSSSEAISKLKSLRPDVVFLDVEMPGGTGFDFLNQIEEINFKIIFVTAFDAYALKAIKYSALDYILKPIDTYELIQAVNKLDETKGQDEKVKTLAHNLNTNNKKIALPTQEEIFFTEIKNIVRLEAEANYTTVFLDGESPLLLSGNLGHFEKLLSGGQFYRTHQSHLINTNHIKKYVKTEGGYLLMSDGAQVPVARMKKEEFKRKFLG